MIDSRLESTLEPESRIVNATCNLVLESLAKATEPLDYSLALAGYFKILEFELTRKIFVPFSAMHGATATPCAASFRNAKQLSRLVNESSISLGEMLLVLESLCEVTAHTAGTVHQKLKAFLRAHFDKGYYFYGKAKLAARLSSAVAEYRNPGIHRRIFAREDYANIKNRLLGDERTPGLVNLAISCMRPVAADRTNPDSA